MKIGTLVSRNKNADSTLRTDSVSITPEVAPEFLADFNDANRPMSLSLARLYANEFLRGCWLSNGENLIYGESLNEEGVVIEHLISGQHRLKGLVIASEIYNKDTELWPDASLVLHTELTRGVSMTVADSVDKGKSRSHTDVLYRSPLIDQWIPEEWNKTTAGRNKWCKVLATAARVVWQREGGKTVSSAEKFVHSEMLTFLEEQHPNLHTYVTLVMNAIAGDGGTGGIKASPAYVAGLGYLACLDTEGELVEECTDKLELFLDQVAQGTGYDKGSAAHAITGFWNSQDPGSKNRDLEVVGPLIKCFNVLMAGKSCTAKSLKLTAKETKTYKTNPILIEGWDRICAENAAGIKSAAFQAKADAKALREEERDAAKLERERKAEEKAEAKKLKAEEKAEAEKLKAAEAEETRKNLLEKKNATSDASGQTTKPSKKKGAAKKKVPAPAAAASA